MAGDHRRTNVDDRNFSDYITSFHRNAEENTDGKAGAYIKKFHQNNSRHYTLPLVLPPPPPSSTEIQRTS
ncbi:hypothetical protein ACS0TY_010120 [Phlomoides rotata]